MNDTREQLERSIDRFLGSWTGWSVSIKVLREAIIGWLDRQAAITERETNKTCNKSVENVTDSRAQLEADLRKEIREYAGEFYEGEDILFALILAMFDRQAAITERECAWRWQHIAEDRDRAEMERDKLQAKLDYLEGHGVEIVDAVAGGYEVYNEWYRKAQELEGAVEMYRRIRAQQSDAADNLSRQLDELLDEASLERAKCSILQTQVRKLTAERDEWKTKCETREFAYKQADAERKRYSEQIDELQAKLDKARNEREMYRECFGKSVDKADEIRAIMAGMGMK